MISLQGQSRINVTTKLYPQQTRYPGRERIHSNPSAPKNEIRRNCMLHNLTFVAFGGITNLVWMYGRYSSRSNQVHTVPFKLVLLHVSIRFWKVSSNAHKRTSAYFEIASEYYGELVKWLAQYSIRAHAPYSKCVLYFESDEWTLPPSESSDTTRPQLALEIVNFIPLD